MVRPRRWRPEGCSSTRAGRQSRQRIGQSGKDGNSRRCGRQSHLQFLDNNVQQGLRGPLAADPSPDCGPQCAQGTEEEELFGTADSHTRATQPHRPSEPILGWNLRRHHDEILMLIEWLSPPAATWCRENNRFPQAYPEDGITLVCSSESNRH
ncbi:protein of unknown function [Stenotrophomonas maltophilia]|nr:protein of unknown function [Stenotrophomonas maltophilia]